MPLPRPPAAGRWFARAAAVALILGTGWAGAQPPRGGPPPAGAQPPPAGIQPPPPGAGAQPPPPGGMAPAPPAAPVGAVRPFTPAVVDEAVGRGVAFLRQSQTPAGSWGKGTKAGAGGGWVVGYTALAGLALLEGGVPPSDPGLQKALGVVRTAYPLVDYTYEVALAILFLDRMGEKKDRPMIQGLAARLIAGQTGTGGWSYKVPFVDASAGDRSNTDKLLGALKLLNPPPPPVLPSYRERPTALGLCIKASDDVRPRPPAKQAGETDPAKAVAKLPGAFKTLPVYQDPGRLPLVDQEKKGDAPINGTTDNSNTHFATIALWAARRHEVPTERSFALLNRRFRTSQSADGSWGYAYSAKGASGGSAPLTCVALLGLAIGHALELDKEENVRPENDPRILKAFKWVGGRVGAAVGTVGGPRPSPKDVGGLYYLWALERIAVLYDVNTLDNKDWYKWGAEILCTHQQTDGSWVDGGYHGDHPALNTAFAILFLKRANLTPDLSRRLLVDPTALTASRPAPAPPPPAPKVDTPPPAPTPPPKVETPPPPAPKATEPAPVVAATPAPAPKASSDLWLWVGIGVGVLALLGLLAFLLLRKKDDEKPAKKGKKAKAARRREDEDEDEDEDDEEEEERPRRRRK